MAAVGAEGGVYGGGRGGIEMKEMQKKKEVQSVERERHRRSGEDGR